MSKCISREGEYSDHELAERPEFVCARCFVFDEDAALAEIARLRDELATRPAPKPDIAEEAPRPLQENLALSSQSRESTGANRVSVVGRVQSISDARHSDLEPDVEGEVNHGD